MLATVRARGVNADANKLFIQRTHHRLSYVSAKRGPARFSGTAFDRDAENALSFRKSIISLSPAAPFCRAMIEKLYLWEKCGSAGQADIAYVGCTRGGSGTLRGGSLKRSDFRCYFSWRLKIILYMFSLFRCGELSNVVGSVGAVPFV